MKRQEELRRYVQANRAAKVVEISKSESAA